MIVITDNRSKCTYARTNRRIRWKYAEWCGRWATVDEAIARVKEIFPGQKVECRHSRCIAKYGDMMSVLWFCRELILYGVDTLTMEECKEWAKKNGSL